MQPITPELIDALTADWYREAEHHRMIRAALARRRASRPIRRIARFVKRLAWSLTKR